MIEREPGTAWSKLKRWERVAIAVFGAVFLAFIIMGIVTAAGSTPSRPQPIPTPIPEIQTSVVEAEEGITCVRVHRGQETLHWECLR